MTPAELELCDASLFADLDESQRMVVDAGGGIGLLLWNDAVRGGDFESLFFPAITGSLQSTHQGEWATTPSSEGAPHAARSAIQ